MADEDAGPETPDWIVTFTDLMSLLLTFFILLLTFSTPKVDNLFKLRGSIEAAFGIFAGPRDERESEVPPNQMLLGREQRNPLAPSMPPKFLPLEVRDPIRWLYRLRDQLGEEIEFERVDEGYHVRLDKVVEFRAGDEHMSPESYARLAKVAKALAHVPYHIVLIGHVGAEEIAAVRASDRDPMDLAIRRAVAVAERLRRDPDIKAEGLAVAGYGPESGGPGRVDIILAERRGFFTEATR
ncbi:MAG: flagellar motor protein MotB [Planctomycetota bacterium]|jgi:chemotaxis protein MotB